jgi:hypothetical protein
MPMRWPVVGSGEQSATLYPDGTRRTEFAVVPHRSLARGPVWVLSLIRGTCYFRGTSAHITTDQESLLVLLSGDRELVRIPTSEIVRYESVAVVEPARSGNPSLWKDIDEGSSLTFVWLLLQDFD